jgi:predicted nucleic acid-binding protein
MRAGYLLDTNQVSVAVTPGSSVNRRVRDCRRRGVAVGTCVPVLCDIEVGVRQVADPAQYRLDLDRLLRQVRVWPLDRAASEEYGLIYNDLRRRGRSLSQVDMRLASLARRMNLILVTTDTDFEALPDIPTENWVT